VDLIEVMMVVRGPLVMMVRGREKRRFINQSTLTTVRVSRGHDEFLVTANKYSPVRRDLRAGKAGEKTPARAFHRTCPSWLLILIAKLFLRGIVTKWLQGAGSMKGPQK
jgi:hypothetical protein